MAQTLSRERKQKFMAILEKWYQDNPPSQEATEFNEHVADLLVEAARSRSELATDEEKPQYKTNYKPHGIEASILAGRPTEESDLPTYQVRERAAIDAFESALHTPANWIWYPARHDEEKTWRDFRVFILKLYEEDNNCFTKYETWRRQKYSKGGMSNGQIKRAPQDFPTGWSDFLASEGMYGRKDSNDMTSLLETIN